MSAVVSRIASALCAYLLVLAFDGGGVSALAHEVSLPHLFSKNSATASLLFDRGQFYNGATGQEASFDDLVRALEPGSVLVLGERHHKLASVASQVAVLWRLAWQRVLLDARSRQFRYPQISVGFEAIDYTQQSLVDQYADGRMGADEFWSRLKWKPGLPRSLYQLHLQAPQLLKGQAVALNAPRWLTQKISQQSLKALSPEERALLPPDFEPPDFEEVPSSYFKRFREAMRGHVGEDSLPQYFEAQSVWDDTMAWRAAHAMRERPQQVLVIVVGDFHVQYGGGLPDRLRVRGLKVVTVSQVVARDEGDEWLRLVGPHKEYGPRGDFVLVVDDVEGRLRRDQPDLYQQFQNLVQNTVLGLLDLLKSL